MPQRLYRDIIPDPANRTLYLAIGSTAIDVMAYSPLEDNSLFTATIELNPAETSHSAAVEEAVYDNPLLLADFKRVVIVSRQLHHATAPSYVTEQGVDYTDAMMRPAASASPSQQMIIDELPLLEASMVHYMESDLYNFLGRTFNQPKIIHRLSVITRYAHGTHRAAGSLTTHVNITPGHTDVVIYKGTQLLLVNTFDTPTEVDTLYYIQACREITSTPRENPVIISGDRELREKVMPLLRRYIPTVMPAVFPAAMFRSGGQTAMNTPTDLVVLPLCE